MTAADSNPLLPPLRPDLEFYPGPSETDGSPTYSVHDPLTGMYHKIGWAEATVLQHLRWPLHLQDLTERVRRSTTLDLTAEDVRRLCAQATHSGLTTATGVRDVGTLLEERERKRMHPVLWLLLHYLYFRIPLIYPERFLKRTLPTLRLLGALPCRILYAGLLLIGLVFVLESPSRYFSSFLGFLNWQGALAYGVTIALLKVCHEFSHAYIATALGVRVRSMGVAFMVFWPIPFCDVTDAWRLRSRAHRALIGTAGILAELCIAGIALFLWGFLEPGLAKSIFFVLSSTSLLSTLLVNLNPAMRFDGYYILSDLWGVENLQIRAFAVSKWILRRTFLGLDDPPPEPVSRRRLAGMLVYSLYTWMYRVGLYLGIAILVYYKFWKPLGLLLFLTEIAVFFCWPLAREVRFLMTSRNRLSLNPRLAATAIGLAALLLWAALPLPRTLRLPAVSLPRQTQILYAPGPGRVESLCFDPLQHHEMPVREGQLLLTIVSEERSARIEALVLQQELLQHQIEQLASAETARVLLPQKQKELERVEAQLNELRQIEELNHLRARLDGRVINWNRSVINGRYVQVNAILGQLVTPDAARIVAYVPEERLGELGVQDTVQFVPADGTAALDGRVETIDPVPVSRVESPSLTSLHGGEIPVMQQAQGVLPVESYYRVDIRLLTPPPAALRFGQPGEVLLDSQPRSHLADLVRQVLRVLYRESGV